MDMDKRYESRVANCVYDMYKRSFKRNESYPFLDAKLDNVITGLFVFMGDILDSNDFDKMISNIDKSLDDKNRKPIPVISEKEIEELSKKYSNILAAVIYQGEIKDPIFIGCATVSLIMLIWTLQKLVPNLVEVYDAAEKSILFLTNENCDTTRIAIIR